MASKQTNNVALGYYYTTVYKNNKAPSLYRRKWRCLFACWAGEWDVITGGHWRCMLTPGVEQFTCNQISQDGHQGLWSSWGTIQLKATLTVDELNILCWDIFKGTVEENVQVHKHRAAVSASLHPLMFLPQRSLWMMFSASSHLLPSVSSSSTRSQGRQQTRRPAGFSFYQVERFLPAGRRIKGRRRGRRRGLVGGRGRTLQRSCCCCCCFKCEKNAARMTTCQKRDSNYDGGQRFLSSR